MMTVQRTINYLSLLLFLLSSTDYASGICAQKMALETLAPAHFERLLLKQIAPEEADHKAIGLFKKKSPVKMGFLEYNLQGQDQDEIEVAAMRVEKPYRGKGYSLLLLKEVLLENPKAKKISVALGTDNQKAFEKALKQGFPPSTAFTFTPFYKIASKLGFTQVIKTAETRTRKTSVNGQTISYEEEFFDLATP